MAGVHEALQGKGPMTENPGSLGFLFALSLWASLFLALMRWNSLDAAHTLFITS